MHNAGFAALGLNAAYVPLEAARRATTSSAFARAMRPAGRQHHGAVQGRPDVATSTRSTRWRRRVGAINTLVVRDGRWIGANTDVDGFLAPLAGRIALQGHARDGARRRRRGARGGRRARRSQGAARDDLRAAARGRARGRGARRRRRRRRSRRRPGTWDVLVNATPAGSVARPANPMAGAPLDGEIVFDLVYAPADTRAPRAGARAPGCLTIGGIEMLVAQAERQFELWTGQRPPAGLFRAAAARDRSATRRTTVRSDAMKQTTFEEFVDLARRGTFVPVVKEIMADLLTPVSAFLKIAEHSDYAFLFESVEGGERSRATRSSARIRSSCCARAAGARSIDRSGVDDRERRAVRRRRCAG